MKKHFINILLFSIIIFTSCTNDIISNTDYLGVWEHVPINHFDKYEANAHKTVYIEHDTLYVHHWDSSNGNVEFGYHIDSTKHINSSIIVLYNTLNYSWLEKPQKDSFVVYMKDNKHINCITKIGKNLKKIKNNY